MTRSLPRSTPAEQQVDPAAILAFLDAVEDHRDVEMHSLMATLADEDRVALREHCRDLLPDGPIEVTACAWAAACPP